MTNARDLAARKRAADLQAVRSFDPAKVHTLAQGLIGQMRLTRTISPLEMIGVGDAIFITVAITALEVAEPGETREAVRKQLLEILDRMRRDIELGPDAPSSEVM